jgi:aryl-alcohol dehydrogenase (NADP+)
MRHVRLGGTGLQVSRLCLGAMTFGGQCDEATSFAILDRAAAEGITFLDTAAVHPMGAGYERMGETERLLGRWLSGRRDRFVVATKCGGRVGPAPWDAGGSRRHIVNAAEASLRRLGTDYIDLFQLQQWDAETPLDETLEALSGLVRAGKVRYVGCSNFVAYQLARAVVGAEARGFVRLASVQPRYNLLFRAYERDLLPLCVDEGVGVIPYNPLAGGFLTGKYRDGTPSGSRLASASGQVVRELYGQRYGSLGATVSALAALAADAGLSLPTLAVAWVLAQPAVTAPIIGASRPEQLAATVAAVSTVLDDDLLASLDELTHEYVFREAPT